MHFNGFERRALAMRTESCQRKSCYALQAFLFLAFYSVAGGYYIYRDYNAGQLNNKLCKDGAYEGTQIGVYCDENSNNLYDVGFLAWPNFSDEVQAQ